MKVFGTGTRQIQLAPVARKREIITIAGDHLAQLRDTHPNLTVISGMAEGWDTVVALAALGLGIPFDAYVPSRTYGRTYWGERSLTGRNRLPVFEHLLSQARTVEYTTDVHGTDSVIIGGVHVNFLRNIRMVEAGDRGMAWDIHSRGTEHCVSYARMHGVPIDVLG